MKLQGTKTSKHTQLIKNNRYQNRCLFRIALPLYNLNTSYKTYEPH